MDKYTCSVCNTHTLFKYVIILSNILGMHIIMVQVLERQSVMMTAIAKLQNTVKPTESPDEHTFEPKVYTNKEEFVLGVSFLVPGDGARLKSLC